MHKPTTQPCPPIVRIGRKIVGRKPTIPATHKKKSHSFSCDYGSPPPSFLSSTEQDVVSPSLDRRYYLRWTVHCLKVYYPITRPRSNCARWAYSLKEVVEEFFSFFVQHCLLWGSKVITGMVLLCECVCMWECVCMCMCVCACVQVCMWVQPQKERRETKEETAVSVLAANNYSRPVFVWLTKACHLASCINSLSATYLEAVTRHGHSLTDECLSWDSLSRISNAILAWVFLNFSFLYRPTSALRPSTTWRHRFISVRITLGHLIHTQPHPSQGGVWLGWWSKQQATCAIASHFALPHVG